MYSPMGTLAPARGRKPLIRHISPPGALVCPLRKAWAVYLYFLKTSIIIIIYLV